MSDFHDVGDFHEKFGLPNNPRRPQHPTRELLEFRLNFLLEELQEIVESAGAHFQAEVDFGGNLVGLKVRLPGDEPWNHAGVFDGLIDLNYVSHGMAHILGYPWTEGWDAVQRANMTKERATRADQSERGGTWDVIKPEGWTPPDIKQILRDHGWVIPE